MQGVAAGKKTNGLRPADSLAVQYSRQLISRLKEKYADKFKPVDFVDVNNIRLNVVSESKPIKKVAVSLPTYLDWNPDTPINSLEAKNSDNRPDRFVAVVQHEKLIERLLEYGSEVFLINPSIEHLEGVYTRDIAVVIGKKCIMCNFVHNIRKPEESTIKGGEKPPSEVKIEGGNVIVDHDFVFLGVGDRTNENAVEWLQFVLGTSKQVIKLELKPGILHLDCSFLPITSSNGLSRAFINKNDFVSKQDILLLSKIYEKLEQIDTKESPMLGINSPCIAQDMRIVSAHAKNTIQAIQKWGIGVLPIDLSEIIKAEGGPRCSTLPLVQE
ncbi:MAG: arginine deiminase-related protein [Candidatus Micrarchaeota archaeon]